MCVVSNSAMNNAPVVSSEEEGGEEGATSSVEIASPSPRKDKVRKKKVPKKTRKEVSSNQSKDASTSSGPSINRRDETPEEKVARRRMERKKRVQSKREKKGVLVPGKGAPKKVLKQFNTVWDRESAFVNQLFQCLPEVRQPGLMQDSEDRAEEYIEQEKDASDPKKEKEMTTKFFERVKKNLKSQGVELNTERAKSYQELKERLHRKMSELAQQPNQEKRDKKSKRKLARRLKKEELSNKGKKLISQSAAAAGAGPSENPVEEKTPLKKKPVVKSNGEIVFSKFDFISNEARKNGEGEGGSGPGSLTRNKKGAFKGNAKLLQKAEKHEKKISQLAEHGRKSEAVDLAQAQKWDTALKRSEGQKVRDDPHLLKKTIKTMDKHKKLTKKKWKERVERVEKQKEARQQKRQTNIQARKDDKKKKMKKMLRKKGRIA